MLRPRLKIVFYSGTPRSETKSHMRTISTAIATPPAGTGRSPTPAPRTRQHDTTRVRRLDRLGGLLHGYQQVA
jgi:hypothetical protein